MAREVANSSGARPSRIASVAALVGALVWGIEARAQTPSEAPAQAPGEARSQAPNGTCSQSPAPPPNARIAGNGRWRTISGIVGPGRRTRRIYVLLPEGYDRETSRRYPVLYVHDGETMADDSLAVRPTLDALVTANEVEAAIVVGVGVSEHRDDEMKPPILQQYARFLVDVVRPFIDSRFRTRCGRSSTMMLGYSLGGLAAFYLALWHPDVFGRTACMSTSFWWGGERPRRDLRQYRGTLPERLWVDVGTLEPGLGRARAIRDTAIARGMVLGRDLGYFEDRGVAHGFESGGRRLGRVLRFLLSSP